MTRGLLACGIVAGPLFTLVYLAEGATRDGYNPRRHPVSTLAIGERGWVQMANFFVSGLLLLAFALGIRRAIRPPFGPTWGPRLIGACAVGLLGAGLFRTDPLNGYPPGTPDRQTPPSPHSAVHQFFSAFMFIGLPAACIVFAQQFAKHGESGWARYSWASCIAFVAACITTSIGFGGALPLVDRAGLLQRITLSVGFGWLSLLAAHLLRKQAPRA